MQEEPKTIFGIDLGTTYTCIAYVDEFNQAVIVPNAEGSDLTPSVVFFENAENRVVGQVAKENAFLHPNSIVEMVKRHMGEAIKADDKDDMDPGVPWTFSFEGTNYSAEEISSYILRKVVGDAEALLERKITDVVITCPAYFGINEREATKRAGKLAGLNVRHILDEPSAAALYYGLSHGDDIVILVYDLGGGTFDITMQQRQANRLREIVKAGNHELGGRDWDKEIVNYVAEQWMAANDPDDDPTKDSVTQQDLWGRAERAKQYLSRLSKTEIAVMHKRAGQSVTVTRAKFEELTSHRLEETIRLTHKVIEEAKEKGIHRFDEFLLVGGSSYMPQVIERIRKEFGVEPRLFEPNVAVAKGAALLGQKIAIMDDVSEALETVGISDWDKLSAEDKRKITDEIAEQRGISRDEVEGQRALEIENVTSHSFGVVATEADSDDPFVSNLIIRNTPLPVEVIQVFGTHKANQRDAEILIMENELTDDKVALETSTQIQNSLLELPGGLPKSSPIEITFHLNEQGMLDVTAREMTTNEIAKVSVQISSVISQKEFEEAEKRSSMISVR